MEQEIINKAEKRKGEIIQKSLMVLEQVLLIIYLVLVIAFVFKPLTEFMSMVEYSLKLSILKYFIN